jgi:hypothetical protein
VLGCEGVDKIQLRKDTFKYWTFINTVMNIWFLYKVANLFKV